MSDTQSAGFPLERSFFYGLVFTCILYGIDFYMYCQSLYIFMFKPRNRSGSSDRMYPILGGAMIFFLTMALFANVVFLDFMWIGHRDFEGGPLAYLSFASSIWFQVLGTVADQIVYFISDGILIYRCYIIWNSSLPIVILPILLYLASIAVAIILAVETATPGVNFFTGSTVNFALMWGGFSIAVNVLVTGLIAFKIITARKRFQTAVPLEADSLRVYTGAVAILVESGLFYTVTGIVWEVVYGKNLVASPALTFIWGTVAALAPQAIIFRVATGHAWTSDTMSVISSLAFAQSEMVEPNEQTFTVGLKLVGGSESGTTPGQKPEQDV
ncbi:hypothetical protein BDZ89DRAFT_1025173 [Hymenopellis radicata]|nr:hypothetical protein BDZ89DRAFT_1025173 [Hymenopellis radicata]